MSNDLQNRDLAQSQIIYLDNEYSNWILELKQRFQNAQLKTAVKVNSELLLFNWHLGKDLVIRKFEEKWGKGVVEQISDDLQAAFPDAKGFSSRNLWFMKQWYWFYASDNNSQVLISELENQIDFGSSKLNHIGTEIEEQKLKQAVSEMQFPSLFSFVPWGHHVVIVQKCKTVKEALYYIKRTIEENLSRSSLITCISNDAFHSQGEAETNFEYVLPEQQGILAKELLKQNYDLSFIEHRTDVRLSFQGITTPLGVATYDNVKIKEISEQIPTTEQIEMQIELAAEEYKMRRDKNAEKNRDEINGL